MKKQIITKINTLDKQIESLIHHNNKIAVENYESNLKTLLTAKKNLNKELKELINQEQHIKEIEYKLNFETTPKKIGYKNDRETLCYINKPILEPHEKLFFLLKKLEQLFIIKQEYSFENYKILRNLLLNKYDEMIYSSEEIQTESKANQATNKNYISTEEYLNLRR